MATPTSESSHADDLKGYEIIVGITGGIAVYKVCTVVSSLVQRGAGVTCVMTRSAKRFVGPLTFESLSGRKALTSLWRPDYSYDPQHIRLTDRADLVLVAPATANIIAKIANGIADDLLSTLMTSVTCPVIVAPAMNHNMWSNPIVQRNVEAIQSAGMELCGPAEGWQACRSVGMGRLAEPADIINTVADSLKANPPKQASHSDV